MISTLFYPYSLYYPMTFGCFSTVFRGIWMVFDACAAGPRSCKSQQETLDKLIQQEIPRLMALVGGVSGSDLGQKSTAPQTLQMEGPLGRRPIRNPSKRQENVSEKPLNMSFRGLGRPDEREIRIELLLLRAPTASRGPCGGRGLCVRLLARGSRGLSKGIAGRLRAGRSSRRPGSSRRPSCSYSCLGSRCRWRCRWRHCLGS